MKILFPKCPVCGSEILSKNVEKLLRGGNNTASITIKAEVCLRCGERLYAPDIVKRFEVIREKLKNANIKGFKAVGKSFKVA